MKFWTVCFVGLMSLTAACQPNTVDKEYAELNKKALERYERESTEQVGRYKEQVKLNEQLIKRQEELVKRNEALMDLQEKQAKRYDALLSKWEREGKGKINVR